MRKSVIIYISLFVASLFFVGTPAIAESELLQGRIKVVGNKVNRKVIVRTKELSATVCRDSRLHDALGKLAGMDLEISGQLMQKTNKRGRTKECFDVANFVIKKTSTGKSALIGTLSKSTSGQYLVEYDGKKVQLANDLPGLNTLVGDKVIVSIDQGAQLTAPSGIMIHSFMKYPTTP